MSKGTVKLGAPTKYKPEFCEKVVELMKEGRSKETVAAELGITKETLYQWVKIHPLFSDAVKKGEHLSLKWWEENGRVNLENPKFNHVLWYMNMKNRHGWSDKQEVKQETMNVNVNTEELDSADTKDLVEYFRKRYQ